MPSPPEDLITRQDIARLAEAERLILDDEDRLPILESMNSIDVQACPGSGKTTLIAAKLILLAEKWPYADQGVCVLSHTNVAKDEIIDRLEKAKAVRARQLLSYPHFIGTIQEFVGKFVAFPLVRSEGIKINTVDTDTCVSLIYTNIRHGTRSYIDNKSRYSNVLYDFDLRLNGATISINVPTFPNGSTSPSYSDLKEVRERLIAEGYFFYKDIYIYAEKALAQYPDIGPSIRRRFPFIFIDEMQDTQKFQDDLLLQIFPLNDPGIVVQRFGDPDQAIFHGIGGEEPNVTFNEKSSTDMDFVINKSHRFDNSIATKIKGLSFNEVKLKTEISDDSLELRKSHHANSQNFEHTVIIYGDENIGAVIPAFAEIVSSQFSEKSKRIRSFEVKVLGAVGNEIDKDDQLKIGHYWSAFDKSKSKKGFKESTLIEAVYYCRHAPVDDWAASYKLLIDCVLKILRMAKKRDGQGKYFRATTMREILEEKDEWRILRELVYFMLDNSRKIDREFWDAANRVLSKLFDLDSTTDEVRDYLAFHKKDEYFPSIDNFELPKMGSLKAMPENAVEHADGFRIGVSTIHGVKGETHDATLVLETKFFCPDLEAMLPYLTGDLPNEEHLNLNLKPNPSTAAFKPNQRFMRQFYVAMSRPKHLLCLAVHASRITTEQKRALQARDWRLYELPLDVV
jgi:superfamily I DNA/RNA helicase